ncbi:MAG: MoaD/ThiS family protein [Deltaproteobacteria bacterium]|nr:MoaD/ThiS family protein [Deltaproteobacteria bacterium]
MLIKIEISSALQPLIPVSGKNLSGDRWEVPEGTQTGILLDLLNLTQVPTMLVLNKTVASENTFLKEGDTLRIFPLVSGG